VWREPDHGSGRSAARGDYFHPWFEGHGVWVPSTAASTLAEDGASRLPNERMNHWRHSLVRDEARGGLDKAFDSELLTSVDDLLRLDRCMCPADSYIFCARLSVAVVKWWCVGVGSMRVCCLVVLLFSAEARNVCVCLLFCGRPMSQRRSSWANRFGLGCGRVGSSEGLGHRRFVRSRSHTDTDEEVDA